jgi:hypothetical protein
MSVNPIFAPGLPETLVSPDNTYRWATVTQLSPLRVRLDGDTVELPTTPESIAGALLVGTRVWVQLFGRRVLILGSASAVGIPWAQANGLTSFTPVTAPGGVSVAVTFPAGRFTVAPVVQLSVTSNGYMAPSHGSVTTTGFQARAWSLSGTPIGAYFHWRAYQMTPTSAT